MTETRNKAPGRQIDRDPQKETHQLAGRVLSDKKKPLKPSGPVTYTIEKGANVWPWQRKA
jgi:hypothetical protein